LLIYPSQAKRFDDSNKVILEIIKEIGFSEIKNSFQLSKLYSQLSSNYFQVDRLDWAYHYSKLALLAAKRGESTNQSRNSMSAGVLLATCYLNSSKINIASRNPIAALENNELGLQLTLQCINKTKQRNLLEAYFENSNSIRVLITSVLSNRKCYKDTCFSFCTTTKENNDSRTNHEIGTQNMSKFRIYAKQVHSSEDSTKRIMDEYGTVECILEESADEIPNPANFKTREEIFKENFFDVFTQTKLKAKILKRFVKRQKKKLCDAFYRIRIPRVDEAPDIKKESIIKTAKSQPLRLNKYKTDKREPSIEIHPQKPKEENFMKKMDSFIDITSMVPDKKKSSFFKISTAIRKASNTECIGSFTMEQNTKIDNNEDSITESKNIYRISARRSHREIQKTSNRLSPPKPLITRLSMRKKSCDPHISLSKNGNDSHDELLRSQFYSPITRPSATKQSALLKLPRTIYQRSTIGPVTDKHKLSGDKESKLMRRFGSIGLFRKYSSNRQHQHFNSPRSTLTFKKKDSRVKAEYGLLTKFVKVQILVTFRRDSDS